MKCEKRVQALCDKVGISRQTFGRWRRLPGFPVELPEGWPVASVVKFAQSRFAEQAAAAENGDDDLSGVKLEILLQRSKLLACEVRRAERADLVESGAMIPMSEHLEKFAIFCRLVNGAFDRFCQTVDSTTLSPTMSDLAKSIRFDIKRKLTESMVELDQKAEQTKKGKI